MRIRMKTTMAGPEGVRQAGQEYDVAADLAAQLVDGGYAELIAEPAAAKSPVPEDLTSEVEADKTPDPENEAPVVETATNPPPAERATAPAQRRNPPARPRRKAEPKHPSGEAS